MSDATSADLSSEAPLAAAPAACAAPPSSAAQGSFPAGGPAPASPGRRAWARFKRSRLGFGSLVIFLALVVLSLGAELLSNDRPLLVRYQGQWYTPLWVDYPETTFGGDFPTPTDYLDPYIQQRLAEPGNWALYAPNRYGPKTLNYFAPSPNPAPPSASNWLGTDDRGRDLLAQLIYGFRISVLFALALTASGVLLGVLTGAIQGYFGGKTDLAFQRFMEVWGAMPELYLLIIFSAVLEPSVALLLVLLSLFGWMGLSDYVRAEFLRNRQMDYVRAARAMGLSHWTIIRRHILPNSLTPVVTFLPFRMSAAILALTSLDFLGLGVPPGTPSLGELLAQGKNNIDAWWISLSTFGVLVLTLLLLTFVGDALRDALDPRKADLSSAPEPAEGEPTQPVASPPATAAGAMPASDRDATADGADVLLDVRGLRVAFGQRTVVHGLDLRLHRGERVAIVGESGSGKTLSALALLGLLPEAQVGGHIRFDGAVLDPARPSDWDGVRGARIAMVFQEPMSALNPVLSIGQQIEEVLRLHRGLSGEQAHTQALALLSEVGIAEPAERLRAYPHLLSGGQRQRALLAMALAAGPQLLLADEPTTALDATLRGQMLELLVAKQQASGMALVLISHDLPLVHRFAQRVLVMQHGRVVEEGPTEALFVHPRHPYTRQLLASTPRRELPPPAPTGAPEPAVLALRGLRVSYPAPARGLRQWWRPRERIALRGVDLDLPAGQTVAVVGESGSGKSTLALAALHLLPYRGQVRVLGQPWAARACERTAQRREIQVVFQDPFGCLSPRLSVLDIVGEGLRVHAPAMSAAERQQRVTDVLVEVGILPLQPTPAMVHDVLQRYPHQFSGGQRQRLAIARALVVQPRALILDEPTSALDVSVQQRILALLQRLQRERGLSYLLITHDMAVVHAMAHHVLVLKDGSVVEQGPWSHVQSHPAHPYTRQLLQSSALAA